MRAGTYGPSRGEGYIYAPIQGSRGDLISALLAASVRHPNVPHQDVQTILWHAVGGRKLDSLDNRLKLTALQILAKDPKAILQFQDIGTKPEDFLKQFAGQALERFRQDLDKGLGEANKVLRPVLETRMKFEALLQQGGGNFRELEALAVLNGEPPTHKDDKEVPRQRWSYHPGFGGFIRYNFQSYRGAEVQLLVPYGFVVRRDGQGRIVSAQGPLGWTLSVRYKEEAAANPKGLSACAFDAIEIHRKGRVFHTQGAGFTLLGDVSKDWQKNVPPETLQRLEAYDNVLGDLKTFFDRNCRVKDKKKRMENWRDLVNITHLLYAVGATGQPFADADASTPTKFLRQVWLAQITSAVKGERVYLAQSDHRRIRLASVQALVSVARPVRQQQEQKAGMDQQPTQIGGDTDKAGEYAGGELAMPGQLGRQRLAVAGKTDEEKFAEFEKELEKDPKWTEGLAPCPATTDAADDDPRFTKTWFFIFWFSPHKGEYEYRQNQEVPGQKVPTAGSQCIYDGDGKLIPHEGTPDRYRTKSDHLEWDYGFYKYLLNKFGPVKGDKRYRELYNAPVPEGYYDADDIAAQEKWEREQADKPKKR